MTDQERLEEIKTIHSKIECAFERNDQKMEIHDLLTQLFEEYHTDWLIETVEEQQRLIAHWKKGFENENKIAGRLKRKFERSEKENARFRKALEFYAMSGQGIGEEKHGEVARQALESEN